MKRSIFFSFLFFAVSLLHGHGFEELTQVKMFDGTWPIRQVYSNPHGRTLRVLSYDIDTNKWYYPYVQKAGKSKTNCYFRIKFDQYPQRDIICTPSQEFYVTNKEKWVPALEVEPGDLLLARFGEHEVIENQFVKSSLKVYTLQTDEIHTFFVGHYELLTHNILFPFFVGSVGLSFGSGAVAGGAAGGFFGPITFGGGIALGGLAGIAFKILSDNRKGKYRLHFDFEAIDSHLAMAKNKDGKKDKKGKGGKSDKPPRNGPKVKQPRKSDEPCEDAQEPGLPTEDDGFIPPKKWDGEKTRHKRGAGWRDKNGAIWIPTGPKGHGGPHWDVQYPDGEYKNIVKGGEER